MMLGEKLDLEQQLRVLAEEVLKDGVAGTIKRPTHLHACFDTITRALSSQDQGFRAMGAALALRMFADSFLPEPPLPNIPAPPPLPPPAPHNLPRRPLEISCPNCKSGLLYALGSGTPLPVICHNCSYKGYIS